MLDRSQRPPVRPFTNVSLSFPPAERLSNGITMHVVNQGEDDVNRMALYVRGGILDESKPLLATMTAATAFEGSDRHTAAQIAQILDFNGAWKAVQCYDDWTELSLWSLNKNFEENLRLLAECVTAPTFLTDDMQQLQRRYAGSYAMSRMKVKYMASLELRRMYYGERHPLAADITPQDILSLSTDDLLRFFSRFYSIENMRVVFSGRITDHEMVVADSVIGHLSRRGSCAAFYDWSSFSIPSSGDVKVINKADAVQSAIAIAIPAVERRHPHYLKLRVLVTVLGGYFGSRLMSNIREDKGYTYGIGAVLAGREHCGYIGISTECETTFTWAVIDEIKTEMARLRDELVPAEELDVVRRYMISDLVKTLDTPFSVASYVASTFTVGVYPDYYNEQVRLIETITAEDLLEMARLYLKDERMLIAIVGNEAGFNNPA